MNMRAKHHRKAAEHHGSGKHETAAHHDERIYLCRKADAKSETTFEELKSVTSGLVKVRG
jgi:hypothetical protein